MRVLGIGKGSLVVTIALVAIAICAAGIDAQTRSKTKPKPRPKTVSKPLPTPKPAGTPVLATAVVEPVITDPTKCAAANGLTLSEISEILDGHNSARSERQLTAVTWNCKLAQLAQEWANKSIYEHREQNSYGENIFVSGNPVEPVGSVVSRWMLEKANWTNETATCAEGKVCTHYAQIMWRQTKSIGCGVNRAATGKWRSIVVCNYDTPSKDNTPAW